MNKKVILCVVFVIIFLGISYNAHSKRYKPYQNTKYSYALKYPSSWFVGYLGGSEKEAVVLRLCTDEGDAGFVDGGSINPLVEILISDLGELKLVGAKLPEIKGPRDWLDWERSNWDDLEKERIGPYIDEVIKVSGNEGIKTTYIKPVFPGAGPVIEVVLFDPSLKLLYNIKYLGSQPKYEENLKDFEKILKSFATSSSLLR